MSEQVSGFDPAAFLQATQDQVNEKRAPIPVENPASPDGLYTAVIGDVQTASGVIGKGENSGKPWISIVIPLKLEIPQQLQDGLGLPAVFTLTDRVFLDLTPQNTIDNSKGKNNGQRAYREALGMNVAGEPFSWTKTPGQALKVKISHEMYNGVIVEKVGGVFKR